MFLGYLPAEHIETPLERLARLNKHRNLDVSQNEHHRIVVVLKPHSIAMYNHAW